MQNEVNENKNIVDVSEIKKKILKDKKTWIIIGAILLVVVLIVVGVIFLSKDKGSQKEAQLKTRLNELAKEFYEVKYYPNLTNSKTGKVMSDEEKKEFAKKFKDTGINIDLDSLARVYGEDKDKILEEFKNGDKACNYKNTIIVIIPKEPFTKQSYEVKVTLDCGFEERK